MSVTEARPEVGFAALIRSATTGDHDRNESAGFMSALMAGDLDTDAVAALSARLLMVYSALESVGEALALDGVAGEFVDPALYRVPSLKDDLTTFRGDDPSAWVEESPAARAYADHLRTACPGDPGAFVAHHYTRYLGDLSGGRAIGAILRRTYGLEQAGATFYEFAQIPDPVAYKRDYRARLDALPSKGIDQAAFIAQVHQAYAMNEAMIGELGARFLKSTA